RSLRAVAAFSSWLFRIVRRECRRLEKKLFGFDSIEDDALIESAPIETLRFEVVQALESMPAHYREVVVLRDIEELTIGEMASRLGMSAAAVKSRLHRARLLLREYLLEE
ncbi:MAG TPA: sigma-70 family RNA polymerase sigma factor, partial [Burkholderiales bacterium]|nr:sigma-70 family RNA polymerase sigma factor [Burkholderiales bacterium]